MAPNTDRSASLCSWFSARAGCVLHSRSLSVAMRGCYLLAERVEVERRQALRLAVEIVRQGGQDRVLPGATHPALVQAVANELAGPDRDGGVVEQAVRARDDVANPRHVRMPA